MVVVVLIVVVAVPTGVGVGRVDLETGHGPFATSALWDAKIQFGHSHGRFAPRAGGQPGLPGPSGTCAVRRRIDLGTCESGVV